MKKLLLSTALVAATSAPGFAQNTESIFREKADPQEIRASNFIGMRVYRADNVDAEAYEGIQDNWEDIGEINDVILSRDGNVEAVRVDIGGFLGIGENQVAVDMDSIQFVEDSATPDEEADFFLILNAPRGALEEAPTYGSGAAMSDDQDTASTSDSAQPTDEEQTASSDDSTEMSESSEELAEAENLSAAEEAGGTGDASSAEAGNFTTVGSDASATVEETDVVSPGREGYVTAAEEELTAENLTGAAAYDSNDERIGEVSQLLMTDEGKIGSAIVDVGGFLGIGEKPVQLEMSKLDILRSEDGTDLRVYVSMSQDELESLPEYEG